MNDNIFMQRALDLATTGLGRVSPNPMVGCVIVHNNEIIGQGWHRKFGGPHAEVMAADSVIDKSLFNESTVYVTLEPCSFQGKTPACTDLLLKIRPKKVVIATLDPNPKVSGSGVEILKSSGINVEIGVLENEAMMLNRRFFISMRLARPYVILKWAETSDRFMSRADYNSKWISNELSRQIVHRMRAEEDGILVGYNTVKYDNPRLNVRDWQGPDPVRIILDPQKQLDNGCKVFDESIKTYWLNSMENFEKENLISKNLSKASLIQDGISYLLEEGLGSIIVEGGAATLEKFIDLGLWDEARIFTAPKKFDNGIPGPKIELPIDSEQMIGEDRLSIIFNPETKVLWQKN